MSNTTAPGAVALADDREYMTPMEFAGLRSDVHHAVWAAFNANAIDSFPGKDVDPSRPQRYRRDQVSAIIRDLEAAQAAAAPAPEKDAGATTQAAPETAPAAAGPGGQP
jgi:hypothetical protein